MGQRYCDSQADVVDGSVVICYTPKSAQVSAAAAAVDARGLLLEATTSDRALKLGAQALTIRVENTYEQGGENFWVDAQISWPSEALTLTVANEAEPQVDYDVQAYLVHRHDVGAPVSRGMRSGHYVAYFKHGASWYLADDSRVTMLAEPPTEFPYVVFLARVDRASGSHMTALRKRVQGITGSDAMRRRTVPPRVPTPCADELHQAASSIQTGCNIDIVGYPAIPLIIPRCCPQLRG